MVEINFEKVKERALRLLARRDHSAFELKQKLRQKLKIQNEDFENLLVYLKGHGYLAGEDDLARRWANQWRQEGRGRHWIQGKLKSKGLPPVELRDDEQETEAALIFLGKRFAGRVPSCLSLKDRGKLARSLISRGFSSSLVATLIR